MTKFVTYPSPFRKGGELIQLTDLLSVLPENNWLWSVLEFNGVGVAPDNLLMSDFEHLALSNPRGFIMTWAKLQQFASSLVQTYNGLIVGTLSLQDISGDKKDKENFCHCEVVIEAFDSSEWSVWARDQQLMKN